MGHVAPLSLRPHIHPDTLLLGFPFSFTVICLGLSSPISDLLKEEPTFCFSYQNLSISAGGCSTAVKYLVGPEPLFLFAAAQPGGCTPLVSLSCGSHSPPFSTSQGGLLPVLLSCLLPCGLAMSDLPSSSSDFLWAPEVTCCSACSYVTQVSSFCDPKKQG